METNIGNSDKAFNKEVALILNSKNPEKDLTVKNGHIVKKDMFAKFTSFSRSEKPNGELKKRISEITEKLLNGDDPAENFKEIKKNLLSVVKARGNSQEIINERENLVVGVLCNRISSVFDPKNKADKEILQKINKFKRAHLKDALQQNKEYTDAKGLKTTLIGDRDLTVNPLSLSDDDKILLLEAKTSAKIVKMKLLHKIGEVGQSDKGTTGTALIFDYRADGTKRLLGVFKPDAQYAPLSVKIGNIVRKLFGQHSLLSSKPMAQPRAEQVAYEASKHFDLLSVPPSQLAEVGGVKGVFQLAAQTFVKTLENESSSTKNIKLDEADTLMKSDKIFSILNDPDKVITKTERNAFQEFALLDFLIGNLDAHGENWFIRLAKVESTDEDYDAGRDITPRDITNIVGIDKANSFPTANPGRLGIGGKNQYLWKKSELAKEPFTEEMKIKMKNIKPETVEKFIEKHAGFFEESMIDLFKKRAAAIREIAEIDNATPADLAMMITDKDFDLKIQGKLKPQI